jgi:hypothetical protein
VGVGTASLATWHAVPPSDKSNGCQIFNHQHGVVRESHFVLFEGKINIHAMQRRMHHGFEPSEKFPIREKKMKTKGNGRGKF